MKTAEVIDAFHLEFKVFASGEKAFTFVIVDDPPGNRFIENPWIAMRRIFLILVGWPGDSG